MRRAALTYFAFDTWLKYRDPEYESNEGGNSCFLGKGWRIFTSLENKEIRFEVR